MADYIIKQPNNLIASIKDMDVRLGIVTGYAASFNTLDSDGDIILPGAFTKSIRDSGPSSVQPRIKHLLNHNTSQPLGLPETLKEDGQGLYYESKTGTHALGVDFLKMVDSGLITEHSIGFSTIKKQSNKDGTTNLTELKLWEFSSLTAWGANHRTPIVGVKAYKSAEQRMELLIKAIANGTFTDTTFVFLQEELLYIQKAFKDISTKPEPVEATILPETVKDTFMLFTNSLTTK